MRNRCHTGMALIHCSSSRGPTQGGKSSRRRSGHMTSSCAASWSKSAARIADSPIPVGRMAGHGPGAPARCSRYPQDYLPQQQRQARAWGRGLHGSDAPMRDVTTSHTLKYISRRVLLSRCTLQLEDASQAPQCADETIFSLSVLFCVSAYARQSEDLSCHCSALSPFLPAYCFCVRCFCMLFG